MELILKYFPKISEEQKAQFAQLQELYTHWNSQINVISRKDIDELYERHILHSLSIARIISFSPGTSVLDVGTGGGFPGIPLAILFPEVNFYLVDSIGKKIMVVQEVAKALQLKNVKAENIRAEKVKEKFDFVVTRAVTNLSEFKYWVKKKFKTEQKNKLLNGILCLKGGDINDEIKQSGLKCKVMPLKRHFSEPFFETKLVVYIKGF